MTEKINHPKHYQGNRFEAIDIIEDYFPCNDFHLANAIKYILRSKKKDNFEEDIRKAIWYLRRVLEDE